MIPHVCTCPTPCTAGCTCRPPRMGTALRAYLKHHRDDWQPLADAGDRVAAGMVDCCTALLNEADRIERGGV